VLGTLVLDSIGGGAIQVEGNVPDGLQAHSYNFLYP
jgi:hypothetical protein